MFDWSISFGNLLTVFVMVISVTTVVQMLKGRVDSLGERMLAVERNMERLVDVLVRQGEQSARMDAQDARITVLAQEVSQLNTKLDRLFEWSKKS